MGIFNLDIRNGRSEKEGQKKSLLFGRQSKAYSRVATSVWIYPSEQGQRSQSRGWQLGPEQCLPDRAATTLTKLEQLCTVVEWSRPFPRPTLLNRSFTVWHIHVRVRALFAWHHDFISASVLSVVFASSHQFCLSLVKLEEDLTSKKMFHPNLFSPIVTTKTCPPWW